MISSSLNIYQRRNAAKKIVYEHEFSKVKGEGLKYRYLPVEQVKPVVEDAWNEVGIIADIAATEISDVRDPWEKVSQYDGSVSLWFHIRMDLSIALVNVDDPADRVQMTFIGEAKDNSDKVISKAYTAALKNFFKVEFNIAEGPKDDPDATQSDDQLEREAAKSRAEKAKDDPFFSKAAPKDLVKPEVSKETRRQIDELCAMMLDASISDKVNEAIEQAISAAGVSYMKDLSPEVIAKIHSASKALKEVPQ